MGVLVKEEDCRPLSFACSVPRFKGQLVLTLFSITEWEGEPHAAEGQPGGVTWASVEELRAGAFAMMELDIPMIPAVCAAAECHAASRVAR